MGLEKARVAGIVPASDLDRAQKFYSEKLGLSPAQVDEAGANYELADGTRFLLYATPEAGKATHTIMGFEVDQLESEMDELRSKGVTFEEYDLPYLKTENGIAKFGDNARGAWFKDSEGNILSLGERGTT